MRIAALLSLPLLGFASPQRGILNLTHADEQLIANEIIYPHSSCSHGHAQSLSKFRKHIREGKLNGSCRYEMRRTYEGDLSSYLILEEGGNASKYTEVKIHLTAPKELLTYIESIRFGRGAIGHNCSSSRISRLAANGKRINRYISSLQNERDDAPRWSMSALNAIKAGDYLIELPYACLIDEPTVEIKTVFVYEEVASHVRLDPDSGELTKLSDQCTLPQERTPIKSQEEYSKLIKSLSHDCRYRYERRYTLDVPATHVVVDKRKTTVIAQIALLEPMLGDQKRRLTMLKLGHVSGRGCPDTALHARRKMITPGTHVTIDSKFYEDGMISPALSSAELADMSYDFFFELPPNCKLTHPFLEMHVVDEPSDSHYQLNASQSTVHEVSAGRKRSLRGRRRHPKGHKKRSTIRSILRYTGERLIRTSRHFLRRI